MPLYLVDHHGRKSMIYAKTPRGAQNEYLEMVRDSLAVTKLTAIEAAIHAKDDVPVYTVGVGEDVVMADDPPQAQRGFRVGRVVLEQHLRDEPMPSEHDDYPADSPDNWPTPDEMQQSVAKPEDNSYMENEEEDASDAAGSP